eukprot:8668-Heterococcus_DN1.PRE.2
MRDSERRHRSTEARDSHRPVRVKHEETEVTPAARSSRDHSAHRRPTKVKLEPRSSEEAPARGYKRSRYDDRTHSRSHYSKGEDRSSGHRRYSREGDRSSPVRGERYGRSPDTKPTLPSSILGAAPSFKVSAEGGETAKFASNKETDPHKLAQRQKQISKGKNTAGYDRYCKLVPKAERSTDSAEHPQTPNPHVKRSKRAFE